MRIYQSLKIALKIIEVDGGWIIGFRHDSGIAGNVAHNVVHSDDYVFVVYPTKEQAKQAAETIMQLRQIPLLRRLEIL